MTEPHYTNQQITVWHGDCLDVLRDMPDCSVDSVCTDPPYSLSFMLREWDRHDSPLAFQQWCQLWATECLRVLRPGGHLLAFGGTRTAHRLACAIEDAGFEIRDSIAWLYGQGFPKSLDVGKAIDRAAGAEREVTGIRHDAAKLNRPGNHQYHEGWQRPWHDDPDAWARKAQTTAPATADAARWQGWGTALKPSHEPIVVARKPLGGMVRTVCGRCQGEGEEYRRGCPNCGGEGYTRPVGGTVAANVLAHGTGALNIDATRLGREPGDELRDARPDAAGRWPPNVAMDEHTAKLLDQQSGETSFQPAGVFGTNKRDDNNNGIYGGGKGISQAGRDVYGYGDSGGASRFMYVAKADSAERVRIRRDGAPPAEMDYGGFRVAACDTCGARFPAVQGQSCGHDGWSWVEKNATERRGYVSHPTVKPLALMRWLVRLVTPPDGLVLDPFAGSGTTAEAALLEGFRCTTIEREADYLPLIVQRINRRLDPVQAIRDAGEDLGLFTLEDQ